MANPLQRERHDAYIGKTKPRNLMAKLKRNGQGVQRGLGFLEKLRQLAKLPQEAWPKGVNLLEG